MVTGRAMRRFLWSVKSSLDFLSCSLCYGVVTSHCYRHADACLVVWSPGTTACTLHIGSTCDWTGVGIRSDVMLRQIHLSWQGHQMSQPPNSLE